jgi:predicted metalloprotease with PDZ domain
MYRDIGRSIPARADIPEGYRLGQAGYDVQDDDLSATVSAMFTRPPACARRSVIALLCVILCASGSGSAAAATPDPLSFVIRVTAPAAHTVEVEVSVPSANQATVELMMATWSPGFYRVENYASRVSSFQARTVGGGSLAVTQPTANRWRIVTGGASSVLVSYRLACTERSVTTNWVSPDLLVLNGPATFMTLADGVKRPHEVRLELPQALKQVATGLETVGEASAYHFLAPDFDTLADSPIVAGTFDVHEFSVDGIPHVLVNAGDRGAFDGTRAAHDLGLMVAEARRLMGNLPYRRYVFLNVFRQGGGGLEHTNSTLLTANAERYSTPKGYLGWLTFATHEYFHLFNVKRIRPIELGPFNYEQAPRTTSLWFSEGVTCTYEWLLLARAGLGGEADFLESTSNTIKHLQRSPGRLVQTLDQSSWDVWTNSMSGIGANTSTISYYTKGEVVGFLLDAHIRHATGGAKSLDDVMRLTYERYAGERGFTADQLREAIEQVAGTSMQAWLHTALASTDELDYTEALDWYGLHFTETPGSAPDGANPWTLTVRPDTTEAQRAHLTALLAKRP